MALPSQGGRIGLAPGGRSGRKKKGGAPVVPVVFFLMLAGGGVLAWQYLSGGLSFGAGGGQGGNEAGSETFALEDGEPGSDGSQDSDDAGSDWGNSVTGSSAAADTKRPSFTTVFPKSKPEPDPVSVQAPEMDASNDQPSEAEAVLVTEKIPASSRAVNQLLVDAEEAMRRGDPVRARSLLSRAILSGTLVASELAAAREDAGLINDELVFTPRVAADDRVSMEYFVESGDTLSRIAKKMELRTDWRVIQRVNPQVNPSRLQLGQRLKLVKGPFHAVVHKDEYRMDVFQGPRETPEDWLFVRSFPVGLGEFDGTPLGEFVVREDSKLINPRWANPRTGEVFAADDPENPIGERWIGLRGLGDAAVFTGYGIHGTIDPDSIGGQESMGCVRMQAEDVALVYELLMEDASLVVIRD